MTSAMRRLVLSAALALATSCGSSATAPSTTNTDTSLFPGSGFPAGALVLKSSLVDQSAIRWITPLGALNPPSHTLPTDHIYFYFASGSSTVQPPAAQLPVYAPGDGTVTWMLGGPGVDSKIIVRQTSTFSYYVIHMLLGNNIGVGTVLTAGQQIGVTGQVFAVDLGVINDTLTIGFVNPSRYTDGEMLHTDAPLKYYTEPLRSQLYGKVQRLGAEKDGTIDYDKAGTLAGNWYSQFGNSPMSFAYDTYDPSVPMISTGVGTYQGVYGISAADPLPRNVTVASGRVLYALYATHSGPDRPIGTGGEFWMLVQMTDDTHLKAEIFLTRPTDFDASAILFAR